MVENVPSIKRRGFSVSVAQPFSKVNWQPAADVYRTPDGWLIKLELAGVCPSEVKVRTSGQRLAIGGNRRDVFATESCECRSLEIVYSQFERWFEFPENVEHARIAIDCRDGIVVVRLQTRGEGG